MLHVSSTLMGIQNCTLLRKNTIPLYFQYGFVSMVIIRSHPNYNRCLHNHGISRWLSNRSMLCLPVQRPSTSSISGIIASGAGSSAIDEDKLRVHIKFIYQQPVLFAMHLLKILSTIFCTAQVLLLCVKSRLPPLHNYSEIDSIVLPIRKKN